MRHTVPKAAVSIIVFFVLGAGPVHSHRGQSNAGLLPAPEPSTAAGAATVPKGTPLFSDTGEPMGTYYPMSHELRHSGGVAGGPDPDVACRADHSAVYCNSLSPVWWRPPGGNPDIVVADDVTLAAVSGCLLDRYVIKVNGNVDGLGEGPYTVEAALYPSCPGAGVETPIPGTTCARTLPSAEPAIIECNAPPGTTLEDDRGRPVNNLYVGIKFSRLHCGIAAGAPATRGFSADTLDFPDFACNANLGVYEPQGELEVYGLHASFYLEVYADGACGDPWSDPPTEAFPNYKGSNHAGDSYTPGGGIRYADDLLLEVPECWMTSMEVAVRGTGITNIDLRTGLHDRDPANGGVVPGTRFFVYAPGHLAIARKDFEPPMLLPSPYLWVGYVTSSAVTGPIITDQPAALGTNEDAIWVHNGTRWEVNHLPDGGYAATDVTIHCAWKPPEGACCDMVLTENKMCVGGENDGLPCTSRGDCPAGSCIGDSICRDDLPEMNCPPSASPKLWVRNSVCEGMCIGGDNEGSRCTRQFDCPGSHCVDGANAGDPCETDNDCTGGWCQRAECDGPFIKSCGLAACCTATTECFNLTERECFAQPPIDEPRNRVFQRGEYCGLGGQRCPTSFLCLDSEGPCHEPHDSPGCRDWHCCTTVCESHPFSCCVGNWDQTCVDLAWELCAGPPGNDECSAPGDDGATLLAVGNSVSAGIPNATTSPTEPGFCCYAEDPDAPLGAKGLGTVWYKFFGPRPPNTQDEFSSVRIDTCRTSSAAGSDSLLQVFVPADADSGICDDGSACSVAAQDCGDESACVSDVDDSDACPTLVPIACNDDAGCGRPRLSSICLPNVVPGLPYYVALAAKDEDNVDEYCLDLVQGCIADPPIPNDVCNEAEPLEGGSPEPLVVPFDLVGGEEYGEATLDCLIPPAGLENMHNDIWYDWEVPCQESVTIGTCDRSLPPEDQPNTTMIVYEGCECPVSDLSVVGVSDFCGFECGSSSCVELNTVAGQCYKIRLGGDAGGTPAGNLFISADCPACPSAPVSFLDPVDGTVDARQPHPPQDPDVLLGIDELLVEAPAGAGMRYCWEVCETATTGTENGVSEIIDHGNGTFTIRLKRPLTTGQVTTITYLSGDGAETLGTFISHPANVDGSAFADGADVTAILDALGGAPPAYSIYSIDIDHSGTFNAADLLRTIDLLNGGDGLRNWSDTPLPQCDEICCAPLK